MKRTRQQAAFPESYQRAKMRRIIRAGANTRGFQQPPKRMYVQRVTGNPAAITERKYFDLDVTNVSIVTVASNWNGTDLSPVAQETIFAPVQGDDYNNRQGRKATVLQIKIRGYIKLAAQQNQTAADEMPLVRLVLVQDKQSNGTQLNGSDVLASGSAFGAINMFQNPANFGRFRVLKDKTFSIRPPPITWDGANLEASGYHQPFKINYKFAKPVVVHFNATNGGTYADIVDNSFHLLAGQDNGYCDLYYKVRTTFVDA